jgi:hypothetical protein
LVARLYDPHRKASEMSRYTYLLVLVPLLLGCAPGEDGQATRNGTNGTNGVAAAAPDSKAFTGSVVETMDAGGYTYARLEHGETSLWAAGPLSEIAVGDELGISLEMKMDGFHSKELDRTFDAVYFVNEFSRGGGAGLGKLSDDGGSAHSSAPSTDLDLTGIATPADGHTVAELWSGKSTLAGSEIVFRGRVVKYNAGIMGRNWLHVQDGTGDAAAGSGDITVTTQSEAAVGDLVLVRGTLVADKDFGAGYQYGLIVEDAVVERE